MKTELMTRPEADKKAYAIVRAVQANNPEWIASKGEDGYACVYLTHKAGAVACIQYPRYPKKGDKFEGGVIVRRAQQYATGPRLSVGISMERSTEDAARDIERRLLPGVLEKYKTHLEGKKKAEDYEDGHRAAVVRMAKAAGVEAPEGKATRFSALDEPGGGRLADIEVNGPDSVTIKFSYIGLDLAEKIIALTKGVV